MASSHTLTVDTSDENCQRNERVQRGQWIRAAILGANDGLLSTTSLMLGVGAAKEDRRSMVLAGFAGAVAGACSMAVGEFVSVSTQRDIEKVTAGDHRIQICEQHDHVVKLDITASLGDKDFSMSNALAPCGKLTSEATERSAFSPGRSPMMRVIAEDAKANTTKLNSPAVKVITKDEKTNTDPVKSWNEKEEEEEALPNPLKAASASALAFLCGSFVPLLPAILIASYIIRTMVITVATSIALVLFGGFGAHLGGSPVRVSAARVLVGGWIAMGISYGLLKPFDREGSNDTD